MKTVALTRGITRTRLTFILSSLGLVLVVPLILSDFRLSLLTKYLCFAIVAAGIGLAWGRGGMLLLGQGVFFGLGGYCMAMYMQLADAGPSGLPSFMTLYGGDELPWWWEPFRYPWFALPATIIIPMLAAAGLGLLIFRRRVRGTYFAILSQAMAAGFAILLIGQQATTGGTNGLTNFETLFGYNLDDPANQRSLYALVAIVVLLTYLLVRQLSQSRYGTLLMATRDAEERVRFLGYDPTRTKLVAYVAAAGLAGLAGALFVPVVGIMSPALVGILPSIEFVIGVALGGRATLIGPIIGAVLLGTAKTTFSEQFPAGWSYLQGTLLIVVVLFLPAGLASIAPLARTWLRRWRGGSGEAPPDQVDISDSSRSRSSQHPDATEVKA